MLDLYIIDQLRREDERSRSIYLPLYIEPPQPIGPNSDSGMDSGYGEVEEEASGGSVLIIDYYGDPDEED